MSDADTPELDAIPAALRHPAFLLSPPSLSGILLFTLRHPAFLLSPPLTQDDGSPPLSLSLGGRAEQQRPLLSPPLSLSFTTVHAHATQTRARAHTHTHTQDDGSLLAAHVRPPPTGHEDEARERPGPARRDPLSLSLSLLARRDPRRGGARRVARAAGGGSEGWGRGSEAGPGPGYWRGLGVEARGRKLRRGR